MQNSYRLLFSEKPLSIMYNNYSFVTGIIQGNNNNSIEPWAYGRYINCMFNHGFGLHIGNTADVWKNHSDYIHIVNAKYGIIPTNKKVAHMKHLLSEGYYIMIILDEQYIPGMATYQHKRFLHDCLLIGFDDEKQAFLLYGRYADLNMHLVEVSYKNVEKAASKESWSFILKYEPNTNVSIDITQIRAGLSHYYYSSPSFEKSKGTKYGLAAVIALRNHLVAQYREKRYFDFRLTRGLMEQKNTMYSMCLYLKNQGYEITDDVISASKSVASLASVIHVLSLKAVLKHGYDLSIAKRISNHFEKLLEYERNYIPKLMNSLA